jgi:uncharacterized ubiquitin-like protein YukD
MKQRVYSILHDFHRCYIGEIGRSIEVHIKEQKYNVIQGLLEQSKLSHNINIFELQKHIIRGMHKLDILVESCLKT